MTTPSKDRTKDLLANWSRWGRDVNCDYAEVDYYVICPDFVGTKFTANNRKPAPSYNPDSAMMVEDVLRVMFKTHPGDRKLLIDYWCPPDPEQSVSIRDAAEALGVSKSTMHRRLSMAQDIFAEQWGLLFLSN